MKERKYFDSGDYNMHKAGVKPEQPSGTAIPTPERLPHVQPPAITTEAGQDQFGSTNFSPGQPIFQRRPSIQAYSPPNVGLLGPDRAGPLPHRSSNSANLGNTSASAPIGIPDKRRPSVGVANSVMPTLGGFDTRASPSPAILASQAPPSSFPIQTHNGSPTAQHQSMSFGQPHGQAHAYSHVRSGSISGLGSSPIKPSALSMSMEAENGRPMNLTDGRCMIDEDALED